MVKFLGPQSPGDGSFNARTYGAVGDGSVNDAPAIQKAIDAASASLMGSTPTFVAAGTVSSGTAATTAPGIPAGYAANDIFIMFVETNFDQPQTAPAGWALVDGFPQANTTNALASQLTAFWKRAAASESAPTLADPGDHNVARIFAFRGCRTAGVPWDTVATTVTNSAGTTLTCPAVTTSVVNNLIVNVASIGVDPVSDITNAFASWTNASLGSVTERGDNEVTAGAGGGFGVATGTLAVPGSSGTTTVTTASTWTVTGTIALAPVEAPGGATVVIPPGNYRLNSQLNLRSNLTLMAYGAYMWSGAANYLLVSIYSAWGFNGGRNINVFGGIWDGKAQDQAAEAAYNVMGFYHCQNVTIRDVSVRNVCTWHGIEINSTNGAVIDNCRFEGFLDKTAAQSRQFSEAVQIDLATNDSTCSKNVTVRGCYMGGPVDNSVCGLFGRAVGSHSDALGFQFSGIRVQGNYVDGTIQQGIRPFAWNDSIVTGNTIINTGLDGIYADSLSSLGFRNLVISGNTIRNATNCGIKIAAASGREVVNAAITDNIVDNCGTAVPAIYPNYTQGSTISGNSVNGGGNIGIALVHCDGSTVSANVITTAGNDGIRVGDSGGVLVSNNRIKNPAKFGIYLIGNATANCSISSNLVEGAGQADNATAALAVANTCGGANAFLANRCLKGTAGGSFIATNGYLSTAIGSGGAGVATLIGNSFMGWSSQAISIVNGRTDLTALISASVANHWSAST